MQAWNQRKFKLGTNEQNKLNKSKQPENKINFNVVLNVWTKKIFGCNVSEAWL